MDLGEGISAVVTGGASGLGEATARRLRARGVKVAIFDFDVDRGNAIAKELDCHFSHVDISDEESVAGAFAEARAANGQERLLVNCAGVSVGERVARIDSKTGQPRAAGLKNLIPNLTVNIAGTFICAAQSAAGMLTLDPLEDGERGAIVNVASTEAVEGSAALAGYSASKGGVLGLTSPMARDFEANGIRVNAILPGFFITGPKMIGQGDMAEAYHQKLISKTVFPKRGGKPDEFAKLVEHIAENIYINGANIRIDAGRGFDSVSCRPALKLNGSIRNLSISEAAFREMRPSLQHSC